MKIDNLIIPNASNRNILFNVDLISRGSIEVLEYLELLGLFVGKEKLQEILLALDVRGLYGLDILRVLKWEFGYSADAFVEWVLDLSHFDINHPPGGIKGLMLALNAREKSKRFFLVECRFGFQWSSPHYETYLISKNRLPDERRYFAGVFGSSGDVRFWMDYKYGTLPMAFQEN